MRPCRRDHPRSTGRARRPPQQGFGRHRAAAPSRSIQATRTAPRRCSACSRWTSSCLGVAAAAPRSAAAPTCASTMNGSRQASRSGAACGSCCFPGFRSEVGSMLLSRRRRQIIDAGSLTTDAPYAEQAARKEGRLDGALLSAWGRVSPYLLSALARRPAQALCAAGRGSGTAAHQSAGPSFARACRRAARAIAVRQLPLARDGALVCACARGGTPPRRDAPFPRSVARRRRHDGRRARRNGNR